MCDFKVLRAELLADFDVTPDRVSALLQHAKDRFEEMLVLDASGLYIPERARPLTRMIARAFDAYDSAKAQHSAAI